jgi:sugar O-acyltransferase (sialic acid O-acetyltransferase NeuD family)
VTARAAGAPGSARRLLILGAGGHGRAVADLAHTCGFTVAGFTDRSPSAGGPGAPVLGTDAELAALIRPQQIHGGVVGVGNTALARRAQLHEVLVIAGVPQPTLVHPRAVASPSVEIGAGSVVFAGCVLGSGVRIGVNAVLYSAVIVEHECAIGDHAYLSPGVVLSGQVAIERGAFLGAGAVVLPGVRIGANAVVAAGAVVTENVDAGQTVMGVPARPARPGGSG